MTITGLDRTNEMTMTLNTVTPSKVDPNAPEEPEIVVAHAVTTNNEDSHLNMHLNTQQQPSPKTDLGFDILCCGDDTRKGVRVHPGTNFVVKLCGNTNIILPNKPPAGAHYKFIMMNLCGDARFLVPKAATVVLRRIALCGNRTIETEDEVTDNAADTIVVKVTIVQLCGDVIVSNC